MYEVIDVQRTKHLDKATRILYVVMKQCGSMTRKMLFSRLTFFMTTDEAADAITNAVTENIIWYDEYTDKVYFMDW